MSGTVSSEAIVVQERNGTERGGAERELNMSKPGAGKPKKLQSRNMVQGSVL